MDSKDQNPPIDRIATTDASAVMDRLVGTELVERGCVVVISVDAIRQRTGDRWPRKRDDVWAYVERKLNEHLSYHDLRQRVSETDFLVAMTTEEGAAAQAIAMKILEEVLQHFLGSAEKVDVKIHAVSGITDGGLNCTTLDPYRIEAAGKETPTAVRGTFAPDEERRRNPVSFIIGTGQELRIDFAVEPVMSLRHRVTAALRIRPSVSLSSTGRLIPSRTFAKLADEDIATIDRATLDYGALFLNRDAPVQQALIMPVSFRTVAARRGRASLSVVRGATLDDLRRGAILELTEVDRGTPTGRLTEVAGLVGQLARGVLVRLQPARDALGPVRGTRMQGLTLDVSELGLSEPHLDSLLRAMALQMRGVAPALMAFGLPGPDRLQIAWEAGFTHAATRMPLATEGGASSSAAA